MFKIKIKNTLLLLMLLLLLSFVIHGHKLYFTIRFSLIEKSRLQHDFMRQ